MAAMRATLGLMGHAERGAVTGPSRLLLAVLLVMFVPWSNAFAATKPPPTATVQATPDPSAYNDLEAVSCSSPAACTAVGQASNSDGSSRLPLAERWDGTTWTTQAMPVPTGVTSVILRGVSCPSAALCMATGEYTGTDSTGHSTELTLAERWDGTSWTILSTPNNTLSGGHNSNALYSVSCTSAKACTAVGEFFVQYETQGGNPANDVDTTIVERWNGKKWAIQPTPTAGDGTYSAFRGVSCASAKSCIAAGGYLLNGADEPLAESWDGTSWTVLDATPPVGYGEGGFQSVSCTKPTACTAVGQSYPSSSEPLAERWDGTSWTAQPVPTPPDADNNGFTGLSGVSCASAKSCTAVGTYDSNTASGVPHTLGERWNGTAWKSFSTPNPGTAFDYLYGVACASPSACESVGQYSIDNNDTMTLGEGFSG